MFKKRKNPSSDKSFPSFESFHEGSHGKARPGGFTSAPSTKRLHKEWSTAGEGFAGFSLDPDTHDRAHSSRKRPRMGSQEQPGTSSQERNADTFEDIPIEWSESEDEQEADSLSDIIPLSPVQSTSREEDNISSSSDQSDAGLPAQPRISQLASSTHQSQSESTPIFELSESTSRSINASPRNTKSMARHTIPKVQGDSRSKQFSHLSRIPQSCAKVQSSVIQKLLLQKPKAKVTAEDVEISDYESASSDEADGGKAASPLEAATGSSVSISTPDPSPANPSNANKGTPKTGSDWLKKVQWQISSPKEGDNEEEPRGPLDSTRKGKKFFRGGLAEQLQRLQSRERASITFWNHKVANSTFDPSDQKTCLMVKVLSSCVECSVHITKCKTLSGHTLLGDAQPPYVSVLFNKQTAEQLGLEPGNTVAIYPPWQKLSIPGQNYPFLLCTYYCQTVTEGTIEGQENLEVEQREIRGPAPSLVTNLSPQKVQAVHSMLTSTRKSLRPSNLFPGTSSEGEASTSVDEDSAAGKNRLYPVRTGQERQAAVRSFLEAIEGLAGRASAGLHVVATVQRVWCQRHQATLGQQALLLRAARSQTSAAEPTSKHRWHLLLEDGHGVFCELQVPNVLLQEEGWAACLHGGEGKEWVFSGLRVTHRANRGRMPTLFSLIDSVWSDSTARESWASQQDSEQSENTYVGIPTCLPPSFCYLVSARSGESRVEPSTDNLTGSLRDKSEKLEDSSVSPVYKSPQVVTLADSEETAADSARISLYVKLRFWRSQPSEDTSSTRETGHALLVWDGSMADSSQPYSKITVRQSCVIPEQVLDLMKQPGANLFLKDLLWERGRVLTADVCSVLHQACPEGVVTEWWQQVTPPHVWNSLSSAGTPGLQVITSSTNLHSLVQVQGQVLSVDEDTAFSWPECDTCGNNKLIEHGSSLQCPSCDKTVTQPLTRMSLEVYVDCPSLEKSGIVKIKLLQDSIQQLLSNQQADDEGYELQAVLGQELRSVDGYLASVSRDSAGERVLMVEEIPQLQDVEMTAKS